MSKSAAKNLIGLALVSLFLWPPLRAQDNAPPEVTQDGYADMIVVSGKIVSMDDRGFNTNPGNQYQAMAVKRDRIMALGTNDRIRQLANSRTKVLDMKGQLVIPGIIETHAHLFGNAQQAELLGMRSPDKGVNISVQAGKDLETTRMRIENGIKDAVQKLQPGDWVIVGLTPNPQERITTQSIVSWVVAEDLEPRARLDTIAPQNPVLVRHSDVGNLNSAGMKLAEQYLPGYAVFLTESMGGKQYADAPDKGLVGSPEMMSLQWTIWYRNQPMSLIAEMIRKDWEQAAAHGITTFSSRINHPKIMDGITWLNREKQTPIRFAGLYEVHRTPQDPQVTRQLYRMTGNLTGVGNDWFWFHGVASERWDTSFPRNCLGPDVEAPPKIKEREMCPEKGDLWWDTLQNALEAGWRLAGVHGEGSDGVRRFIRMIELARSNTGATVEDYRKLRMTVEHAPSIGKVPDIIKGLKDYGIIVSIGTGHYLRAPAYLQDYGPKIEPFITPVRSLLANGVKTVGQNHTYRNVGYLWSYFVTRNIGGQVIGKDEAIDRVPLLKMWTTWASEYVMKEQDLGTLEVGKMADFVVLDKDFFAIPVEQWTKIRPQMTVVGGNIRYLGTDFAQTLAMDPVGYQFPPNYDPWGAEGFSTTGI
ncbi:MAG: amidohydrolase family protein [Acidobacteria bacterium]|nr:amidohydrolase family protein [Acidobacteriota bacterium]